MRGSTVYSTTSKTISALLGEEGRDEASLYQFRSTDSGMNSSITQLCRFCRTVGCVMLCC